MRKCKCKVEWSKTLIIGNYYYYEIIQNELIYFPYYIYLNPNASSPIGTFSKDYFDVIFVDIEKERKEKLKKLNAKF